MAHLWLGDEKGKQQWAVLPLQSDVFLTGEAAHPVDVCPESACGPHPAVLRRSTGSDGELWSLTTVRGGNVLVNGIPQLLGLRVLRDRDEIRVGCSSDRIFFSTERLACVQPFPGLDQPAICPRDRQELAKGYPAVLCPQCGVWYHQSEQLPCWTYSERCALCDHPTELGAGFRWTPEEL